MRRLFFALTGFCVFVPAACFQALPSAAQTAAAKPVDPKMAASQAAFEAFPDEQRRAIQNDLVWATDYSGAALGTFGKLTFEALSAFEKKAGGPVDAILDPAQRQKLSDAANKARASVGFKVVQDPNTGSGIGIATKYMGKPEKAASGSKWAYGNDIILETVRTKPDKADMAATFERFVSAVVEGRKVTYKLLRPDFFVVTGELASQKFYTRFAPTPDGLRGYTLTYNPNISPDIEKLVIATANTFEPIFSGKNGEVEPAAKDVPTAALAPAASLTPGSSVAAQRFGTALVLAKGLAATPAAAIKDCKAVLVSGKPVQISDAGDGVALLSVEGIEAPAAIAAASATQNEGAVAFGFGADKKLQAAPGELMAKGTAFLAALQAGLQGGVILSANGDVRGLLVDDPATKPQIAGVALASRSQVLPAAALLTVLEKQHIAAGPSGAPRSTGELSQIAAKMLVSVVCQVR